MTEPPTPQDLKKMKCPQCAGELEWTQVFESYDDYLSDGAHHWAWRCKHCGHKFTEKELRGYETCNCVGCM